MASPDVMALFVASLLGGDPGASLAWELWQLTHPVVRTDAGVEMRCRDGKRPWAEGEKVVCRPRPAP